MKTATQLATIALLTNAIMAKRLSNNNSGIGHKFNLAQSHTKWDDDDYYYEDDDYYFDDVDDYLDDYEDADEYYEDYDDEEEEGDDYYYDDFFPQEEEEYIEEEAPQAENVAADGSGGRGSYHHKCDYESGSDHESCHSHKSCHDCHKHKCPCKDELCDLKIDSAITLEKVCHIKEDTQMLGQAVVSISGGIEANNDLLHMIYDKLHDCSCNCHCCEHDCTCGDHPCVVINCGNGDCPDCPGCDTCCPECPPVEPPGGPGEGDVDFCLPSAPGNMLIDGQKYTFSQMGITKSGWKEFFLASSAMNDGIPFYEGEYHGWNNPPVVGTFTNGLFMIRNDNSVADQYSEWTYDTSIATLNLLEGGQLKDTDGNCLGFVDSPNFDDGTAEGSTRIQWVECLTDDFNPVDNLDPVLDDLKKQLWFGDLSDASLDKIYLRQVCSNNMVRRIKGDKSHTNPLYEGETSFNCKKKTVHFELDYVPKNLCVNDYGFNLCLFNMEDITP